MKVKRTIPGVQASNGHRREGRVRYPDQSLLLESGRDRRADHGDRGVEGVLRGSEEGAERGGPDGLALAQ